MPESGTMSSMSLESEERPWGAWHVIDVDDGYKIKRIHVTPGSRLSLQTHEHRSEHWVVIAGVATCTVGDVVKTVAKGESLDVPLGAKHRLANEGETELVIVEVQLGSYTGEDDICRIEDDYGR
jgi:mannose-6-phosphate isomerase-like protein (cupin superfamily)